MTAESEPLADRVRALAAEWANDRGILSPDSRFTRDVMVRELLALLDAPADEPCALCHCGDALCICHYPEPERCTGDGCSRAPADKARAEVWPRLLLVPDEETLYTLLCGLNYGSNPEVGCNDRGRAFISTLTDPGADYVNYVYTDESGHSRCVVGCENCGSEGNQRIDWKPQYPVTVLIPEMPDLNRAEEDGADVTWLRAALTQVPVVAEPTQADSLSNAMDRMDDFWEAFRPEMRERCADECGECFKCGASWANSWTYAALSNAKLVRQAEGDGCGTTPLKAGTIPTPQNPATSAAPPVDAEAPSEVETLALARVLFDSAQHRNRCKCPDPEFNEDESPDEPRCVKERQQWAESIAHRVIAEKPHWLCVEPVRTLAEVWDQGANAGVLAEQGKAPRVNPFGGDA